MAGLRLNARRGFWRRSADLALFTGLLMAGAPAAAEPGILLADARPGDSEALATGDQLLLTGREGALRFAGRELRLAGFSGIVGFASEVAYVVVIAGEARDGALRAAAGQMLLIPPYGAAPSVQRFDAARLRARWSAAARTAEPASFAQLGALAARQHRGLFFGRLARTSFNVAAPGGAERELAGRSVRGAGAVRDLRFSGRSDPAAVERGIVEMFLAALVAGDAERVASLMDPVPFGNTDLRGGAAEARLAMARLLIGQRDWSAALSGAQAERDGQTNNWRLNGPAGRGAIALRPMGDFAFVRAIEMGGR